MDAENDVNAPATVIEDQETEEQDLDAEIEDLENQNEFDEEEEEDDGNGNAELSLDDSDAMSEWMIHVQGDVTREVLPLYSIYHTYGNLPGVRGMHFGNPTPLRIWPRRGSSGI